MALILKDRVLETSTTTGTGTIALGGAVTDYQGFTSAIGAGNTTYYTITNPNTGEWEVGIGTVGTNTLTRDTVLSSSTGSKVSFTSGTKNVFCDYPASKAVYANANSQIRVDGNAYVDYESAPTTTVAAGRSWYDGSTGSWNLGMGGGNITQQVGEELYYYGKASSAITDSPLQIVYKTGTVGASGTITFAPTVAGLTDGDSILGVATESIALNGFGRITTFGLVHGVTTNGTAYGEVWNDGDTIWYNPVTGNPTNVKPVAPNIKVAVGTLVKAGSGGSGSIQVEVAHGSVLGGTDANVQLTSPANGNILTYSGSQGYWKNTALTAGSSISVSPAADGTITISATGLASGLSQSDTGTAPWQIPLNQYLGTMAYQDKAAINVDSGFITNSVAVGSSTIPVYKVDITGPDNSGAAGLGVYSANRTASMTVSYSSINASSNSGGLFL